MIVTPKGRKRLQCRCWDIAALDLKQFLVYSCCMAPFPRSATERSPGCMRKLLGYASPPFKPSVVLTAKRLMMSEYVLFIPSVNNSAILYLYSYSRRAALTENAPLIHFSARTSALVGLLTQCHRIHVDQVISGPLYKCMRHERFIVEIVG